MLAVEILEGIRMMLRMANLICVGAALALLAGCTSVEERLELRKPTARLVGVRFQEATPRAATLVFDVELQNYYPLTVPLVGFKYSVSSAGQMFLSGSSEARVNLPASSQRTVALPVTIDYLEVLKILGNAKPGATIPYQAELDLSVETPRLGPVLLPVTHMGVLTLPAISEAIPQSVPGSVKTQ
jgi:LEA14-like dessication related protein